MSAVEQTGKDIPVLGSDPQEDPGPVIGGLNLRSAPGACLLFAGVLLLVGIGVAVGGYWPHHAWKLPPHQVSTGRTPAEKLKLVGPVIMGLGLFVFICANTLLYENRDRQQNPIPTRSERRGKTKSRKHLHPQVTFSNGSLALCELNIHSSWEGVVPALTLSSPSSDSSNSIQVNFDLDRRSHLEDRDALTLTLPVIKLNNSLISCSEVPPFPERKYRNWVGGDSGTKAGPTPTEHSTSYLMRKSNT